MKRFTFEHSMDGSSAVTPDEHYVEYALYEEAREIEVDRDIKAANLQLLVDKVLASDLLNLSTGRDISPAGAAEEDKKLEELVELARSLKQ